MVSQGHQLSVPLLESVKTSNDLHKSWVRRKLKALLPSLDGVVVVVWGLTYKPGTDTLRRSLAVELCNWLIEQGARVRVHDPVVKELPTNWNGCVQRFDEALGALEGLKFYWSERSGLNIRKSLRTALLVRLQGWWCSTQIASCHPWEQRWCFVISLLEPLQLKGWRDVIFTEREGGDYHRC